MKKLLLILFTVVIFCSLSAQDYTFKVLVNKGQNQVKTGNDWLPIKIGASLKAGDELKISSNAYLGLVHKSGKPLEVKDAGAYKVTDLAAKVKGGSSVLNKYTDFILSSKEEKRGNLVATGAVTRGDEEILVYLVPQQSSVVFNDQVSIIWAKNSKTSDYVVRLNSMFGDELYTAETKDTVVTIDLGAPKLMNEDNIVVTVTSKSDPNTNSESFMLKKLSPADKVRIKNALSEIASSTKEETALNKFVLASFYEQNSLLVDASTTFQQAVKLAPNVADYRQTYGEFLIQYGLEHWPKERKK
jgi:hypothetical protein